MNEALSRLSLLSGSLSQAVARLAVAVSVAFQAVQGVSVRAVRLASVPPCPPNASTHVLSWRDSLKVLWVLARRIAAKVVGVLRRPVAIGEEEAHPVGVLGPIPALHPDASVAVGITIGQPWPTLIGAAFIHLWPVTFFERFRARAFLHGLIVAAYYE